MKLLTLNTHSWIEKDPIDKLQYIAKVIYEEGIDIVALQEINQKIESKLIDNILREDNFGYLLLKELKEKYGVEYQYRWDYHHIGYDIYEEGTALLVKGKVLESFGEYIGNINDPTYWKTRKYTRMTTEIDGEICDVYSCHMGWWNDEENSFQDQLDDIIERIGERKNKIFLMGDLNNVAEVRGEGYDYLLEKGLYDTYTLAQDKDNGITVGGVIDGWKDKKDGDKAKRIDFIFTNKEIRVKSSKVIFNGKNRDVVSDHFGVMIEI